MRWYDHAGLFLAVVLALYADYDASRALRASILVYFTIIAEEGTWLRAYDLRVIFGPSVYTHLRRLLHQGIIERRESPGGPERGRRPDYWYRRRV